MCSSQPDCLDVVWNICVVLTPEEDRQGRDRGRGRGDGEGLWDPRAVQKEALSFSITAVATTMVVVLSLSRARGQCEADAKCVRGRRGERKMEKRKQDRDKATVWGAVSLVDDLWSWRLRLAIMEMLAGVGERGVEKSSGPNLRSTPPLLAAAAPQLSSLPVCLWCLFTSPFNHGAVPVVDWHKMTAA